MRHRLLLPALAVPALLLAACGDSDDDAAAPAADTDPCEVLTLTGTRVNLPPAQNTAAYMTIENTGDRGVTLTSAATDLGTTIELHESSMDDDGVMSMAEVPGGIDIPAGDSVDLEPGGLHVMVMGVTRDVEVGDDVELTLTFDNGCVTDVVGPIEAVTSGMADMDHDHSAHGEDGDHDHSEHEHDDGEHEHMDEETGNMEMEESDS